MGKVRQVFEYRFPSGLECAIASISMPVDDIARRHEMRLETWEEDGLGPAQGFFVRLPSGRVVLIRQLAYATKHFDKRGPDVFVDSDDVVNIGVAALVGEVLQALDLPQSAITWIAEENVRQKAADMLGALREQKMG